MRDPETPDSAQPATSWRASLGRIHEVDSQDEHVAGQSCAVFGKHYI